MTVYEWTIRHCRYSLSEESTPDRIYEINWTLSATEGGTTVTTQGFTSVDMAASDATEESVVAILDEQHQATKDSLGRMLDDVNTPREGVGLPWLQQHPVWSSDTPYAVADRVNYLGTVFQCIQAHTSQGGWTPDVTPALWATEQDPNDPDKVWMPGEAVEAGDLRWWPFKFTERYECIQSHTTQQGWEPPDQPALWKRIGETKLPDQEKEPRND